MHLNFRYSAKRNFGSVLRKPSVHYKEGGQATTSVWLPDHNFHWKLCLQHSLHFTHRSSLPHLSVPHLSAPPPNFFNFNCLFYVKRELVRFFGDVMVSIPTYEHIYHVFFFLHKHIYWLPGAIVAWIPIKLHFCVKYDLRQCTHPGCFRTTPLF